MKINKNEFLKRILGYDSYEVEVDSISDISNFGIKKYFDSLFMFRQTWNLDKVESFYYTKIGSSSDDYVKEQLMDIGFKKVIENLQYVCAYNNAFSWRKKQYNIREVEEKDLDGLIQISYNNFYLNRFTIDNEISKGRAKKYYLEKIYDYYMKSYGNKLFVAEHNNNVIGYLASKVKEKEFKKKINKIAVIDLITVHENYRGKGVANDLLTDFFNEYSNLNFYQVATEGNNKPAINFFIKNGFVPFDSYWIYHMHLPIKKYEPTNFYDNIINNFSKIFKEDSDLEN